jgi:hypothetical protein
MIDGIRIDGPGRLAATERKRPSAAAGFAVSGAPADANRAKAAEAAAHVSLDGMLALQEAVDAEERDRRAGRHGRLMLAELAALQRDLLCGDTASLRRLTDLAASAPLASNPALVVVMNAIILRARVEIARRTP